jgi:hypothetical protein
LRRRIRELEAALRGHRAPDSTTASEARESFRRVMLKVEGMCGRIISLEWWWLCSLAFSSLLFGAQDLSQGR